MSEIKKTPLMIDDKEYFFEDLNPQQQLMVSHIADLDNKIKSVEFNLDQLLVGKEAFVEKLKASLANPA